VTSTTSGSELELAGVAEFALDPQPAETRAVIKIPRNAVE